MSLKFRAAVNSSVVTFRYERSQGSSVLRALLLAVAEFVEWYVCP